MNRKFYSKIVCAVTLFLTLAVPSYAGNDEDLSMQALECGPNAEADFVRTNGSGLGGSNRAIVFKITGSSSTEQRAGFLAKPLGGRPDEKLRNIYMNIPLFKGSVDQLNDCVFELLLKADDGPGGQPTRTFTKIITLNQFAPNDLALFGSKTVILHYDFFKGSDPDAKLVEMACYLRGNKPIEVKIDILEIRATKSTVFIPSILKLKTARCNALPLR